MFLMSRYVARTVRALGRVFRTLPSCNVYTRISCQADSQEISLKRRSTGKSRYHAWMPCVGVDGVTRSASGSLPTSWPQAPSPYHFLSHHHIFSPSAGMRCGKRGDEPFVMSCLWQANIKPSLLSLSDAAALCHRSLRAPPCKKRGATLPREHATCS